jgi:hypothetical protein
MKGFTLSLFFAIALCAQNATPSGVVQNRSDASIPQAVVTAAGTTQTTVTNEAGAHTVPTLLPGVYKITVEASAFFNANNHPNFGNPAGMYNTATTFGVPTAMFGRSLNSASAGSFNALYQVGGPASIRFSLKVPF